MSECLGGREEDKESARGMRERERERERATKDRRMGEIKERQEKKERIMSGEN